MKLYGQVRRRRCSSTNLTMPKIRMVCLLFQCSVNRWQILAWMIHKRWCHLHGKFMVPAASRYNGPGLPILPLISRLRTLIWDRREDPVLLFGSSPLLLYSSISRMQVQTEAMEKRWSQQTLTPPMDPLYLMSDFQPYQVSDEATVVCLLGHTRNRGRRQNVRV